MSMDVATVKKVAKLARIRVEEKDFPKLAGELSGIFKWIEQLQEVGTDGVAQMTSVVARDLPMRRDEVTDGDCREKVLANAPKAEFDCFAVPKVIE